MRIRKLAGYAATVINQVSKWMGFIAIIFILAMMGFTVTDIFLRYVFRAPILGNLEVIEYLMVVAGFLGVAWCAVNNGHLKVDMIMNRLPSRTQAVTDSITLAMGTAVVAIVAWQSFVKAQEVRLDQVASAFLNIPAYPFYLVVGVSYGLLFLAMLPILIEHIRKGIQK